MKIIWSPEAEKAVSRVPFFIRKRVRQRVEDEARHAGSREVRLEHVHLCQTKFMKNMESEVKGWQLETCMGVRDCPHQAVAPSTLIAELEEFLAGKNLKEFLQNRVGGPLKMHHEFRISLSSCPNGCSRPQIADIGLIGAMVPVLTSEECSQCNQCVAICKEGAIITAGNRVELDLAACLKCGDCARVCPTGTIISKVSGFRVLLGGKLGRHPQLGRELPQIYPPEDAIALVERCLNLFMEHYQPGQRFGDILKLCVPSQVF